MDLGVQKFTNLINQILESDSVANHPSGFLGAFELSPWEVATLYQFIVNDKPYRPTTLWGIDQSAQTKGQSYSATVNSIARQELLGMLKQVFENGTAKSLRSQGFVYTAFGKTGTTNSGKDLWFAGFTPQTLCIIWMGLDQPGPTKLSGSQAAAPIWKEIIEAIDQKNFDYTFTEQVELRPVKYFDPISKEVKNIELIFER